MSNIAIYNGTSSFTAGSTPFGFYDTDNMFVTESDQVVKWCAQRLGYPVVEIELQNISFYTAFEEAITTYGNEVYAYKVRENYFSMEGNLTSSILNNQLITPNLGSTIRISETYASEAGSGGYTNIYTGSVTLQVGQQYYDLNAAVSASGVTGSVEIKRVFYEAPPAIVRYFDPYAGTGTGIQSLLETFGFGQFSPGINFLLMPIYADVAKIQAIELNDTIRKSAYSFNLINNQLQIFPIPNDILPGWNDKLYFNFVVIDERNNVVTDGRNNLITNISNVPYENPVYSQINSIGKTWIRQYTLALIKEMLAYVRGKYSNVPIPGSEITLNQSDLLSDARKEKEDLLVQLRATLDAVSRKAQMENQSIINDVVMKEFNSTPIPFYIF
jgi:hypothetical protein